MPKRSRNPVARSSSGPPNRSGKTAEDRGRSAPAVGSVRAAANIKRETPVATGGRSAPAPLSVRDISNVVRSGDPGIDAAMSERTKQGLKSALMAGLSIASGSGLGLAGAFGNLALKMNDKVTAKLVGQGFSETDARKFALAAEKVTINARDKRNEGKTGPPNRFNTLLGGGGNSGGGGDDFNQAWANFVNENYNAPSVGGAPAIGLPEDENLLTPLNFAVGDQTFSALPKASRDYLDILNDMAEEETRARAVEKGIDLKEREFEAGKPGVLDYAASLSGILNSAFGKGGFLG